MLILAAAKPSLIDINFGLMFWTIVSFLIVLVVLKKFAFGPIQATLDERRNAIAADIDAAEHAREEAQSALAEYRQALADSRREATKIIEEARRAAEQQRTRDNHGHAKSASHRGSFAQAPVIRNRGGACAPRHPDRPAAPALPPSL